MSVLTNGNEIHLAGMVGGSASGGDDWWGEPDGFSSGDVTKALQEIGRENPVTIIMNSAGGYAHEGSAIHAILSAHKGAVNIKLQGVCMSAATVIACAGDTVQIAPGCVFMVHDPATFTMGDAAEHRKTISYLEASSTAYAGIYADKTGKSAEEMREMMVAESYFTPEEAVAAGFADAVLSANDNEEAAPVAFNYTLFSKAPERLVALAQANGWARRSFPAATAASHGQKETPMTHKPAGGVEPAAPVATPAAPAVAAAAPSPASVIAIASALAEAHHSAEQIEAFIIAGGDLAKAQARAAEVKTIDADLAAAKRCNPDVSLTVQTAVAEGLNHGQVLARIWPEVTAQREIETKRSEPAPKAGLDVMAEAAAEVSEAAKRTRARHA